MHLGPNPLTEEYLLNEGRFPGDAARDEVRLRDLPAGWISNQETTQSIGERWVAEATSAILIVPSVLTAHESASLGDKNILLNPRHPEFATVRIADQRPFRLDSRLFAPQS